jgi:YVTN family beta-propeller protein
MRKIYFIIFGIFIVITGCNRDSVVDSNIPQTTTKTKTGLFILCEGAFSIPNSSSLSFYDFDSTYYDNIFSPGNLGSYTDGMIYDGNNLLITEQGSYGTPGKIYRVDTSGKEISSQSMGINPYSLCIANNKIYVTHGLANSVSVLDFNSLALTKTINAGLNPQEILSYNNKVYVCNEGNYSAPFDSTVYVIDAQNDVVIDTIELQKKPSSIALSRDNKLLVGCENVNGKIYKIDPETYVKLDSFTVVSGFYRDISIDKSSDNIYFISFSKEIVKLNLSTRLSETIISNPDPINNVFYGYIFDSKRRNHYIANVKNYSVRGYIHKYDIYGTNPPLTYQAGFVPRRFLLLDN